MRKKILAMVLSILMFAGIVPIVSAKEVTSPNHFVFASIGLPENLDPPWVYDSASLTLLQNIYDPLIFFKVDRPLEPLGTVNVRGAGKYGNVAGADDFEGRAAESFEKTIVDGLPVWTFKIKEGMPWHNPIYGTVTAEDVEYSIERGMVLDHAHGPQWMFFEPLLGTYGAELTAEFAESIDDSIEVIHNATGDYVQFNLGIPYPDVGFLTIMAQSWASILCKDWAVAQGCWPGFDVTGYDPAVWGVYHDPTTSPLADPTDVAMGSGPYKLDYWVHGLEWSIIRFADYHLGWPAPDGLGGRIGGYVSRATEKLVTEWATRRDGLLAGVYDNVYVPTMYKDQVEGQPGVVCIKSDDEITMLDLGAAAMFYTFDINTASPYMGVPGGLPPGTLAETGIPPDFFADIHVRKAFSYLIDFDTYLADAWLGEAVQPTSPIVEGLLYSNPANPVYSYDPIKAEEEFKLAWGGNLWTTGFTMDVCYNIGNVPRQTLAEMVRDGAMALNSKFHITTKGIEWGATYIPQLFTSQLTMFVIGWGADFADPHNFAHPFMHSEGAFSGPQMYNNTYVDGLIESGILLPDGPAREALYFELQEIYYDDCPSIMTHQALIRRWQRDWVSGWYYNAIYFGNYYYHKWKGYLGDTDADGDVDIDDLGNLLIAFDMSLADAMAVWGVPAGTDVDGDAYCGYLDLIWGVWWY
jgi:peptide/nickel transport system substrate-binding protein